MIPDHDAFETYEALRSRRAEVEAAVDDLLDLLDAIDAATEDMEDDADHEPSLGAPENNPLADFDMEGNLHWNRRRHRLGSQLEWAAGGATGGEGEDGHDREPEAGYDLPEGDLELDGDESDKEPLLGAPENHALNPDQRHWSQGGGQYSGEGEIGHEENESDKWLPSEARAENERVAREAGRQAEAMKRRKTSGWQRDPDFTLVGNLRFASWGGPACD